MQTNASKYFITLFITILLFVGAFYLSSYFNGKKMENIKSTEDHVAVDLLSYETQFDVFKQSSCDQMNDSVLSGDLDTLSQRLSYMENQLGIDNPEVTQLKKYYSVLQIKDYLLTSTYDSNCHKKTPIVLYFYSTKCSECTKQDYVVSYLHDNYPQLHIYSFDRNLDTAALNTLININKISTTTPSFMINEKSYVGYLSSDQLDTIISKLIPASKTATTTKKQ